MDSIDLLGIAFELQAFCDGQGWQSCFIGGLAVQRWSQARVTRDVDLTLLTGFGNETSYIEPLLGRYAPRIANAGHFALRNRVLLLKSPSGVGIDISLAGLPFEHSAVARSSLYEFAAGVPLRTCSAEDLMVMKLFAFRGIDQRDAEGIAIRNGTGLDWGYVEEHLVPLAELKEDPAILREFHRLRAFAVKR